MQVAAIQGGALQKLLVILATDQSLAVKKKVQGGEHVELNILLECL